MIIARYISRRFTCKHITNVYAKQNDATLIEVNPEKTVMSNDMDLSIQATSASVLPKILSILKNG